MSNGENIVLWLGKTSGFWNCDPPYFKIPRLSLANSKIPWLSRVFKVLCHSRTIQVFQEKWEPWKIWQLCMLDSSWIQDWRVASNILLQVIQSETNLCLGKSCISYLLTHLNISTRQFFKIHVIIYVIPLAGGWGSAPDPTGRAYSAPPDPLAVRRKGREGRGGRGGKGRQFKKFHDSRGRRSAPLERRGGVVRLCLRRYPWLFGRTV